MKNRVIKFRAYDDRSMIYSHNNDLNESTMQLSWFFNKVRTDAPIMQFTGLTDKNGKEIYEGDIITINLKNNPFKIKCTVIYKQSQCQFMAMEVSKKKLVYQLHHNRNIEVIGNIYENPELL